MWVGKGRGTANNRDGAAQKEAGSDGQDPMTTEQPKCFLSLSLSVSLPLSLSLRYSGISNGLFRPREQEKNPRRCIFNARSFSRCRDEGDRSLDEDIAQLPIFGPGAFPINLKCVQPVTSLKGRGVPPPLFYSP